MQETPSCDIRFIADRTLGRLVKWLRIFGFDTLYEPDCPEIVPDGAERIRLTRIRMKKENSTGSSKGSILILSDHFEEQIIQVFESLQIARSCIRLFSRCVRCNQPTETIDKTHVEGRVPDYIWEVYNSFQICPGCHRIYWSGSHIDRSVKRINTLLGR